MKTLFKYLAVLTVLAFSFAPSLVRAQDDPNDQGASFQTFYDQLGSQGNWVQTGNYGYVFQPTISDPNWAPYTDGHWVYTDVGWTWVSAEPWGWATYHYGRWINIDGTGWVWVPGYRWAPAWVSWRYGGGYCGWAPLPPESFVGAEYGRPGVSIGIGFHFGGDVDVNFGIGAGCYSFLRVGDMGEPNYRGAYINRNNNYGIINHTTNITNINVNKSVTNNYYGTTGTTAAANNLHGVTVGGPPISEVNAHSHTPIQTVKLTTQSQPGQSTQQGNSLAVYAPKMNPASVHDAKPATVAKTIDHPTFNRGTSITKPLAVNENVKPAQPTPEAVHAAELAQAHVPAKAKIATAKTKIKTTLSKPLTSMEPVTQVHKTAATTSATTQPGEVKPATTYHPETVAKPQTEVKPATTYHPESEVKPQTEVKPATTYHPESTVKPPTQPKPTTTYHPENTVKPPSQPKPPTTTHPTSTTANKPASGTGTNKPENDQNKPQGQ